MRDIRTRVRHEISRREIPGGLALAGAAVIVISLVNWVIPPRGAPIDYLETVALGAAYLAVSAGLRSPRVPAASLPWIWVALANLLVALLLLQYHLDPRPVGLAWVIAVMVTFLPVVGDWAAAGVGAGISWALTVVALWAWDVPDAVEYALVATSAIAIGLVLLRRRLAAVDELADAQAAVEESASTDALTGVFNRRGLQEHLDPMMALAQRSQQRIFAAFVDVRGLKAANDRHGHDFGDEVLVCVVDALRSCMRASDVLGRWGGDEFVVVGLGEVTPSEVLEERVRRHALESDIDSSRWSAGVTVGIADSAPGDVELMALINRADEAMYERRRLLGDSGR